MTKILCAIRGGEASYRTQDEAIRLAKKNGSELYFFYVADSSFLDRTAIALRKNLVEDELEHMGEFLLTMALVRAKDKNINASIVIKHGNFIEELKATVAEMGISTVVLGKPAGEGSVYSPEELANIANQVSAEIGIEVLIM